MSNLFTTTVLISGRGSNLKSLILNAKNYKIRYIVSDNPNAPGLDLGDEYGIERLVFSRSDFQSKAEFSNALFEGVASLKTDLTALAGFMRIVPAGFVKANYSRLVNIHPSLLPAYPGLNTHARVLAAKERVHGCTVHFVDEGVDTGPVIAQARCDVKSNDTEEILAARVLKDEHRIYPWVLNHIARGNISLTDGKVVYSPEAKESALQHGFYLPLT